MSLEVEAKLKVDRHDEIRGRLSLAGASAAGRVLEVNRIFDDAHRSLLSNNCGLRVRACYEPDGGMAGALMTYKGPQQAGPFKSREEIETRIDDPQSAAGILAALGFKEVLCFEKRRETWHLDQCTVELDELPHLGCFVEIEGPGESSVRSVQEKLGLGELVHQPQSYIALLAAYCRAHDLPTMSITFS